MTFFDPVFLCFVGCFFFEERDLKLEQKYIFVPFLTDVGYGRQIEIAQGG